ncbi:MAG: divalent-cation tolerance protein CutA [Planctomycetota bacterium]
MLVAFSTTPDRETAERIARLLVEERLAACVQIDGPIRSVYRWPAAIEADEEWRLVIKTTAERWPAVERAVLEAHPYDTPQLVAAPITHAAASYAAWLAEQVGD